MIFHYNGKFDNDEESLPHGEHKPGAVAFREADAKKLAVIANTGAALLYFITLPLALWRAGGVRAFFGDWSALIGILLSVAAMVPHEFLHASCFRGDVYMYQNLSRGLLFVTGPEDMSKGRFVFMSMLPNLVFGFVPFILFLIWPQLTLLGALGAVSIPAGFGDYYNVFNALTQMPRGARTYLYGFHSYWYQP